MDADDKVDYFHFSLSKQRTVRLRVRRLDHNADRYVENNDGTVIASSENTGDQREIVNITLAPTGANEYYYARVEAKENGQNDYELRYLTDTPPNEDPSGLPTINGAVAVDKTLSADTSGISDGNGLANATFNYQWMRSADGTDADIADATGSSYTITEDDEGSAFKVAVGFTDDAGYSESLTSAPTAVLPAPNNIRPRGAGDATGAPTISGTAQVDNELTANTDDITDGDGLVNVDYTYQWIQVDPDGTNPENVGSDQDNYTLLDADAGKRIQVKVTFEDDAGNAEELTSDIYPSYANVMPEKGECPTVYDWCGT